MLSSENDYLILKVIAFISLEGPRFDYKKAIISLSFSTSFLNTALKLFRWYFLIAILTFTPEAAFASESVDYSSQAHPCRDLFQA